MASLLISSLMTLALGILFIILKAEVIGICITLIGAALIIVAIIDIFKLKIFSAIVKALLGILVLIIGWKVTRLALLVIGIVLLIYGVIELFKRLFSKKGSKKIWLKLVRLIQPIFCILASLLLIRKTGEVIDWAIIISGIFFIVDGVLGVINALSSKKN